MKPDWSTAPEWAMWWVVDPDRKYYWFENEPEYWFEDKEWFTKGKWEKGEGLVTEDQIASTKEKRPDEKAIERIPTSEERIAGALRALNKG